MSSGSRTWSLWAPVVAYMGFLFALSSIAHTPQAPGGSDKHVHALLYAGLAILTLRALTAGWFRRLTLWQACLTVAIATAYGISDEFHQSFVPPRTPDGRDVVADAVGACVACLVWLVVSRLCRTRGV